MENSVKSHQLRANSNSKHPSNQLQLNNTSWRASLTSSVAHTKVHKHNACK
jgi:hypothetical protein